MLNNPAEEIREIKNKRKKIKNKCKGQACQALRILADLEDIDIEEEELGQLIIEAEKFKAGVKVK